MIKARYLLAFFVFSLTAQAREVDLFPALAMELPDSAEIVNGFLNPLADEAVVEANAVTAESRTCADLTLHVYDGAFRNFFQAHLNRHLIKEHPEALYPSQNRHFNNVWSSQYRWVPIHYIASIAQVANVDGVYMGLDKLGHFFGRGGKYYRHFLKAKKKDPSRSEDEIIREFLEKGIFEENTFLGYYGDGVFSFADLEANYQGFAMAQAFCDDADPLFRQEAGVWKKVRDIDIRPYVNPYYDEAFYPSLFRPITTRLVKKRMRNKYCDLFEAEFAQSRLRAYQERVKDQPLSLAQEVAEEYFQKKGKTVSQIQAPFTLENLCR